MGILKTIVVAGCIAGLAITAPASAQTTFGSEMTSAEKLRRLDIMLMVTSLRCRMSEHDFQAEYRVFSTRHLNVMNEAARELRAHYQNNRGASAGRRALDGISTGMANEYGQGHPWLECHELREIALELSQINDRVVLLAAADEYLSDGGRRRDSLVAAY